MDARKRRGLEIQDAIRQVLLQKWNPIGIDGLPCDEYDSYIAGVWRLLVSGASVRQLAEHLASVEKEYFGLETSPERLIPVAEKPCRTDVRLDTEEQRP